MASSTASGSKKGKGADKSSPKTPQPPTKKAPANPGQPSTKKAAANPSQPPTKKAVKAPAAPKVVVAKPGPPAVPPAEVLKQARAEFLECRVRAVNPTPKGQFWQNQSLLAGYLNLQNTEQVRDFISAGPCFDKAILPWAQIREDKKWHVHGRTLPLEKKVFMKVFATQAGLHDDDAAVDQEFAGETATLQEMHDATIRAVKLLIKHGPPEMFWRTEDACPWDLGAADWIGGYIAEDVSRALELLLHAVRARQNSKGKTGQVERPQNKPAECVYYLTSEDLTGQSKDGVAEKLSADHFSHIDFETRQRDALTMDIAAHPALTPEERHQLGLQLDKNISSATVEFNRLTVERGIHEGRPSLTWEQQKAFGASMLRQVTKVWPRPDGSSSSVATPSDAERDTMATLAQQTEQLTALAEARKVTAADKEPQPLANDIEHERQAKLQFQQDLVKSAAPVPTYAEGCQYLGLEVVALEDLPPIDPQLHRTNREAYLEALAPHANPQFTENLQLSPHQVTGVAVARMMETSPLHGLILADDMGLGKTVTGLSVILASKRTAVRDAPFNPVGTKKYKPTLVVAPSACLLAWKADGIKFFSKELTLHYFIGTPGNASEEDRPRTVGSHINDLKDHVASLNPDDPETERHVYYTTVGTWAHRVVKLKEGAVGGSAANPSAKNVDQYRTNEEDEDLEDMDEINDDDYEHLCQGVFGRIIVDEAHCLKGLRTKAHKSVVEASPDSIILMTGTPISNRLSDFAGMLRILWRDQFEPADSDFDTHVDTYTNAMQEMEIAFAGLTVEEKLSADNFSDFLYLLNPKRFGKLARESEKQVAYHSTGVAAAMIPPIFSLCVVARSQGSVTQLGPHQVVCAEVPSATVNVVEIKMLYAQRMKYREIHLDEASRATTGPTTDIDDNDSAAFGNAASTRRLVMASCDALLDAFHTKGHAAARIFAETLGAAKGVSEIPDRATDFFHRITRPEPWLPPYSASRILDAEYQCSLSSKKSYLIGRLMEWLATGEKAVLFGYWPQTIFDIEVLLNTLCIPFVSVKALSHQTIKQRDKAVARFQDRTDPARVMVTSLRVAGVSYNFQIAPFMMMFDFPPAAAIAQQGIARIVRMGQKKKPVIEILLAHNTVDQIIAARTEAKHIPIIAGAANLKADQYEVENAMRDDNVAEHLWVENYGHYENKVIDQKASRIWRMLIGSRCSHVNWSDFNVDLIDFLPGGEFEDQPAKKKVVEEQWIADLKRIRGEKTASKSDAMKLVSEAYNITLPDLERLLKHHDSLLTSLDTGTVATPATGAASKRKPPFKTKPIVPSGSSPFTPLKASAPQQLSEELVVSSEDEDDFLSDADADQLAQLESRYKQDTKPASKSLGDEEVVRGQHLPSSLAASQAAGGKSSSDEEVVRGQHLPSSLAASQAAGGDTAAGAEVNDMMEMDTPATTLPDDLADELGDQEANGLAGHEADPTPSPFTLASRSGRPPKRKAAMQAVPIVDGTPAPTKRRRPVLPKATGKGGKKGKSKQLQEDESDGDFVPEA